MRTSRSTPLFILGAVAAALLLSGVATAQVTLGPRVGPGTAEVRLVERNAERLELDDKTIAAVQALGAEASAEDEKLNKQLRDERLKLRDLLSEELPEEAALMKQSELVSKLGADIQKLQMQTTLRVRKLLTVEQRKELLELRKNVRQPRRRRQQP
jgi:Spy/CpxP family protein refolding chaperone